MPSFPRRRESSAFEVAGSLLSQGRRTGEEVKIIKSRGHFPSDESASKLIWLALRNITADWSRASRAWKSAMNQFAIIYEDRFTLAQP